MGKARPLILGIGGTTRVGSSTERALRAALAAAEAEGAETTVFAGAELDLPMYVPGVMERDGMARRLVDLYRQADGFVIASPAYHGSISGLIKNVLDYTEDLRSDERVYFDGCAVGCICCAGGAQAAAQTLAALRAITHALRGWPTPLGAAVNTSLPVFDEHGAIADRTVLFQLETVGRQVAQFALMRKAAEAA